MKRDNHYETAFEEFLRARRMSYVAVDETRRSTMSEGTLKSLDFIVSSPGETSWLVDVKGRRFPSGEQKQYWKNWSTRDDLASLAHWEQLFGARFRSLLVFAYYVVGQRAPLPAEQLFQHRGRTYGFVGVQLADYAYHARAISAKWDTLAMPAASFRALAKPLADLLAMPAGSAA